MKLNKLFLGLLGMAAFTFAACSDNDDDSYESAPMPTGSQVFFPKSLTSQINLSETATSFNIPIQRYAADAAETVNLKTTATSDRFNVPTTVTFNAGSKDTVITVTYDPSQFEYAKLDTLTIAIDESVTTPYGLSSYTFTACVPEPFVSIGMGTYYDGFLMDGGPYEVEILQNKNNPSQYRIMHPYDTAISKEEWPNQGDQSESITLTLLKPGDVVGDVTISKNNLVLFTSTNSGYFNTSNDYNQNIWLHHPSRFSDLQSEDYFSGSYVSEYKEDGTPGVILLGAYYYMDGIGGWSSYITSPLVEIVFPDYDPKDYTLEVEYLGKFETPAEEYFANFSITMGADIDEVKYVLIEGKDVDSAVSGIVDGSIEGETISEDGEVKMSVAASGQYTLVAVGFAEGEAQAQASKTIKFQIGAAEQWKALGTGLYTEDCLLDLFKDNDGNQLAPFTYQVEVEESMSRAGVYRMVNPYGAAFPYNEEGDWDASKDWYVEINAQDPTGVFIEAQETGLDWGYGMFSIQSMGSYYMDNGYSFDDVKAAGYMGTLADGIISFPENGLVVLMGGNTYKGGRMGEAKLVLPSAVPASVRQATDGHKYGKMVAQQFNKRQARLALITDRQKLN